MWNLFRTLFAGGIIKPKIEISLAERGDERGFTEVKYKAWLAVYTNIEHGITEDDIHYRWRDTFSEARLTKRREEFGNSQSERVFVAKIHGKIIGMCRAVKEETGNRVQAIYVDPENQGKGVGRALWNTARSFFDPQRDTYVDVVDYNMGAIGFYEKLGFRDTGKRKIDERFRMKSGSIFTQMEMVLKVDVKEI